MIMVMMMMITSAIAGMVLVIYTPEVVHSSPSILELSVLNTHLPGTPMFDVVSISTTVAVRDPRDTVKSHSVTSVESNLRVKHVKFEAILPNKCNLILVRFMFYFVSFHDILPHPLKKKK